MVTVILFQKQTLFSRTIQIVFVLGIRKHFLQVVVYLRTRTIVLFLYSIVLLRMVVISTYHL